MELAWYSYTIAIILIAICACSVSVMLWVLTQQRRWVASGVAFAVYVTEQALIFYSEYSGEKPFLSDFFNRGLMLPPLSIALCVTLLTSWWAFACMRVHAPVTRCHITLFALACAVALSLVAPVGTGQGVVRNMLYWGFRDCIFLGSLGYCFWWYHAKASANERTDIDRDCKSYLVLLVLMCCMLCEDIVCITLLHPTAIRDTALYNFFWHLTERNMSENVTMVYCAYRLIKEAGAALAVFSNHPAEGLGSQGDQGLGNDLSVRLPRFCDEYGISKREGEVLRLLLEDKSTQEISTALVISLGTVKAHLHRIYTKAGVTNRKDLVALFWRFQ